MKILLVEDNSWLVQLLKKTLGDYNYVVDVANDSQTFWSFVKNFSYDLILIDLMMPVLDGINFVSQIRTSGYQAPILLLTEKNAIQDGIYGLNAGADDYIIKPYNFQDLLARIRALSRRSSSESHPIMVWGDLRLDPNTCEVSYKNIPLKLTPLEYRLLQLFLRNGANVLCCSVIINNLWSFEEYPQKNTVKSHIKRLRKKLKNAGAFDDLIQTVYGLGYRLNRNL